MSVNRPAGLRRLGSATAHIRKEKRDLAIVRLGAGSPRVRQCGRRTACLAAPVVVSKRHLEGRPRPQGDRHQTRGHRQRRREPGVAGRGPDATANRRAHRRPARPRAGSRCSCSSDGRDRAHRCRWIVVLAGASTRRPAALSPHGGDESRRGNSSRPDHTRQDGGGARPAGSRSAGWPRAPGLIHPNLATMLAVVTNRTIRLEARAEAIELLRPAVDVSFNSITIDGECFDE